MGLKHLVYRVAKFQSADGTLGLELMEQVTQSTIFAKISFEGVCDCSPKVRKLSILL